MGLMPLFFTLTTPRLTRLLRNWECPTNILECARVEPCKGQLALLEASSETTWLVVFIGSIGNPRYYQECQHYARNRRNALFLGVVPHRDLPKFYAAAKVHALPSYRETPGLASLEAGAMGCNIVTTIVGSAHEYFGDDAWYCDPGDIGSIRSAVCAAYNAPKNDSLKKKDSQSVYLGRSSPSDQTCLRGGSFAYMNVLLIFGTRPEAIKLAPVIRELRTRPETKPVVCVTAQHRQMLDQALALFSIQPHYDQQFSIWRYTLALVSAVFGRNGLLSSLGSPKHRQSQPQTHLPWLVVCQG